METILYCGYHIAGNQHIAIAINANDPTDVHYFDIDPDVNNDAYERAQGWAYDGGGGWSEAELREWMERLAEASHTLDGTSAYPPTVDCGFVLPSVPIYAPDAYVSGCCDGEIYLAREILRKFLK